MKEVHLFVAIRRTKENPNLKEHCIRHIIRDYDKDLKIIKAICANNEGVYRIYKTVNPRSTEKAWKELQHKLIENPQLADRLESEWKTALLQPKCKADDKLLIDVDSTDFNFGLEIASKFDKDLIDSTLTPNGRHFIINRVDTRCLDGIENIEVKRDALVFVDYANTSDWKVHSKHCNKGGGGIMQAKLQITISEDGKVTIDSDDFWYIDKHNIQSNTLNNDKLKELLPKIEKLFKDNKYILLEARRNCNDYRLQDISITSFQAGILKRIESKGRVTMKLVVEDNDIDNVQFAVETLWRNGLIDRNTYNGQVLYNVNEPFSLPSTYSQVSYINPFS